MDSKLLKTIRRLWEPPEPEIPSPPKPEFQPGKTCYDIPPPEKYDLYDLDPLSKRKMTICNLFVNHGKSISEIIELLDVSRKMVIDTLLENSLIKDRRQQTRQVEEDQRQ